MQKKKADKRRLPMHPCIVYLFPVISKPEPEKMATP